MQEKLKPCPFCGGEPQLNYERIPGEDKGFWAQVICKKCYGRSGGTWAGSYNAAERKEIKAWNRRAYDVKEIITQEAAEFNKGWIPCSERLPEKNGNYIVTVENKKDKKLLVKVSGYSVNLLFFGVEEGNQQEVTAWQPLPEPYQPKGE